MAKQYQPNIWVQTLCPNNSRRIELYQNSNWQYQTVTKTFPLKEKKKQYQTNLA